MTAEMRIMYTEVCSYLRANLRFKNSELKRLHAAAEEIRMNLLVDAQTFPFHVVQANAWRAAMNLCA
jgi:hypothetical protein